MVLRTSLALVLAFSLGCGSPGHEPASSPAAPVGSGAPPAASASKEDIPPEAATGLRQLSGVRAERQMIASANPYASEAGLEMLRAGGSAVDAAVAIALVLTLVEPQSSGIGGGAFLLHYDAQGGRVQSYDGREVAPASARPDMFLVGGAPRGFLDAVIGGLSVGVPGELRMLELAHRTHGKLPWSRLFEPAIRLAEEGFVLSERLHQLLALDERLARMAGAGTYFYQPDGTPKPVGTVLKNPELGATLRAVASGGADAFHRGEIARDMVAAVRKAPRNPSGMTLADVEGYRAVERPAVCMSYRSWKVCGMPPPSSGGVTTLEILGLLERFDMSAWKERSVESAHLFAEAGRLAYADRDRYLADPDFVKVPSDGLLDRAYLARRSKLIDPQRAAGLVGPGEVVDGGALRWGDDASGDLPSTSHLVVVDDAGNVVSMTASIESAFGSHLMVRGFLLNNELTDFSFLPEVDGKPVANRVEPGKRPRSSMAPVLVLDAEGRFLLALGSPGGSRIIAYVARTLVQILDGGLEPQLAIARPNVANRNGVTEIERMPGAEAWAATLEAALAGRGHQVKVGDLNSGLQAIMRVEGGYVGGADPRREGVVVGD